MDINPSPMGNLIGFDAATLGTPGGAARGRRASDRVDGSSFAEVYDLAAFAATGSRSAARVDGPAAPVPAAPSRPGLSIVAPGAPVATAPRLADELAAERLFLDLTSGGAALRIADERPAGPTMRLLGADGAAVRELRLTSLGGDDDQGPEVA